MTETIVKREMEVDIGITEEHRKQIAEGLSRLLADSYYLYLKTQNYHWNVTGQLFQSLHEMFQQHYENIAEANDVIAERIRTLGYYSPGTFREFSKLTSIEEDTDVPEAMEMVRNLVHAHEAVIKTARSILPVCDDADDEATIDLLTERLDFHSKTAWMLRSHLSG